MVADKAQRVIDVIREVGDTVAGRFEADKPAARRRDADRTKAVAGMRHRHDPGRNGCRRSARRSAGNVIEVPRIPRRAIGGCLDIADDAEFGRRRPPEQDRTRRSIAADQTIVFGVDHPGGKTAPRGARPTGNPETEILDQHRHPGKGCVFEVSRRGACFVEGAVDHGIDLRIVAFEPDYGCLDDLAS